MKVINKNKHTEAGYRLKVTELQVHPLICISYAGDKTMSEHCVRGEVSHVSDTNKPPFTLVHMCGTFKSHQFLKLYVFGL